MPFGVNLLIWTAHFTEEHFPLLPKLKQAGFDGVEIPLFHFKGYPARKVRRALEAEGLRSTICTIMPKGVSVFDTDASVRRQALRYLQDAAKVSAEIGAEMVAGPVYSPVGWLPGRRRTEEEWKYAIETYRKLGPTLDKYNMTVGIEPLNRFETFFLNLASDGAKLCDAVDHPRIGLLVDTFHSNIEEKKIDGAYRAAGRHLKHVHTCENDRGVPGSGHVEWKAVFKALRELKYDGWLTIESFGFNMPEIAAAAAIWRDLASTPDDIALGGLKFLKKNWG